MENVKTIIVVAPDGSKKNVEPQPKLKFRDKDFVLKSDGESALRIESPVIGIKPEKPQLETVCALIDNWMNKRVWRLTSAKGANFDFASGDDADVAYVEVVAPNGRPSDADVTDVKTKILDWLKSLSTRTPKPEAEKPAAPAAAAAPAAPAAPAAAPAAEKPAEEKPAAPAAPKPEDKPAAPAAEKPAAEKPAAPAAEKPAEDKPAAPAEPPKGKTWKELEDEGKSIDEILDYFMGK